MSRQSSVHSSSRLSKRHSIDAPDLASRSQSQNISIPHSSYRFEPPQQNDPGIPSPQAAPSGINFSLDAPSPQPKLEPQANRYELSAFSRNLTGPTLALHIGRSHHQQTFTIHSRILTPNLTPTSIPGPPSAPPPLFASKHPPPVPEAILTIKDIDPTTFSSVLEYLYSGDYEPRLPLLGLLQVSMQQAQMAAADGETGGSGNILKDLGISPSPNLLTLATTLQHLKIGLFARKNRLQPLVAIVRRKLRVTVGLLSEDSLFDLAKTVYGEGYAHRRDLFRFLDMSESVEEDEGARRRGAKTDIELARAFWSRTVLARLMGEGARRRDEFLELVKGGGCMMVLSAHMKGGNGIVVLWDGWYFLAGVIPMMRVGLK
ncbi:hypothetical protein BJ508DRAFT_308977 [Ascobolus immersus RN42]|uniref:BTB domain-containing protein n=1 Tax=Ascobolus immersus RN42 TaxID=1160509 RepID=A0A3N4HYP0_ASCIM|nr:hypothetical protein BJ508DRAFT_308977 [Ascobolus immersus RN42]